MYISLATLYIKYTGWRENDVSVHAQVCSVVVSLVFFPAMLTLAGPLPDDDKMPLIDIVDG